MKTPVEKINELLVHLPEKDVKFAEKFIKERDFEALRDLVKSDITITLNKLKGVDVITKEIAVSGLRELFSEVNSYCTLLGYDSDILDDDNNIETVEDEL